MTNKYQKEVSTYAYLFPTGYNIITHRYLISGSPNKLNSMNYFIIQGVNVNKTHSIFIVMDIFGKILIKHTSSFMPIFVKFHPNSMPEDDVIFLLEKKMVLHLKKGSIKEYIYDDFIGTNFEFVNEQIIFYGCDQDPYLEKYPGTKNPINSGKQRSVYFNFEKIFTFDGEVRFNRNINSSSVNHNICGWGGCITKHMYDDLYLINLNNASDNESLVLVDISSRTIIDNFSKDIQCEVFENSILLIDIPNKNFIRYHKKNIDDDQKDIDKSPESNSASNTETSDKVNLQAENNHLRLEVSAILAEYQKVKENNKLLFTQKNKRISELEAENNYLRKNFEEAKLKVLSTSKEQQKIVKDNKFLINGAVRAGVKIANLENDYQESLQQIEILFNDNNEKTAKIADFENDQKILTSLRSKGEWREYKSHKNNKTYYYHTKTQETSWKRPPEMDIQQVLKSSTKNLPRCNDCGGFGVGLVSVVDHLCNHCRRKKMDNTKKHTTCVYCTVCNKSYVVTDSSDYVCNHINRKELCDDNTTSQDNNTDKDEKSPNVSPSNRNNIQINIEKQKTNNINEFFSNSGLGTDEREKTATAAEIRRKKSEKRGTHGGKLEQNLKHEKTARYNLSSQEIYGIQSYYKHLKWSEGKISKEKGCPPKVVEYALSTHVNGPMIEDECSRYRNGCGNGGNMFKY